MGDDTYLIRSIIDEPDEDTPRLAYADWLDENGQHARAEYIRISIELTGVPVYETVTADLITFRSELSDRIVAKVKPYATDFGKAYRLRYRDHNNRMGHSQIVVMVERVHFPDHDLVTFEHQHRATDPGRNLVIIKRVRELYDQAGMDKLYGIPYPDIDWEMVRPHAHRGFVELVCLDNNTFSSSGSIVFRNHPVKNVRMPNKNPLRWTSSQVGREYIDLFYWVVADNDSQNYNTVTVPHCLGERLVTHCYCKGELGGSVFFSSRETANWTLSDSIVDYFRCKEREERG